MATPLRITVLCACRLAWCVHVRYGRHYMAQNVPPKPGQMQGPYGTEPSEDEAPRFRQLEWTQCPYGPEISENEEGTLCHLSPSGHQAPPTSKRPRPCKSLGLQTATQDGRKPLQSESSETLPELCNQDRAQSARNLQCTQACDELRGSQCWCGRDMLVAYPLCCGQAHRLFTCTVSAHC